VRTSSSPNGDKIALDVRVQHPAPALEHCITQHVGISQDLLCKEDILCKDQSTALLITLVRVACEMRHEFVAPANRLVESSETTE
jgi:hypothetical protein